MTDTVGVFCLKPKKIRLTRLADLNFTLQTTDSMQTARQWLETQAICCLLVCPWHGDRCLGRILRDLAGSGHSIPIFVVAPEEEWRRIEGCASSPNIHWIDLNDPTTLVARIEAMKTRLQFANQLPLTKTNVSPRIRRALKFMEQNFARIQSAAEVSGFLEVANSTFLREFQKNYKMPFKQYLIWLRLRHAVWLGQNKMLSGKEIAERCGYNEIPFYKMIKQKTGMTFTDCRKRLSPDDFDEIYKKKLRKDAK